MVRKFYGPRTAIVLLKAFKRLSERKKNYPCSTTTKLHNMLSRSSSEDILPHPLHIAFRHLLRFEGHDLGHDVGMQFAEA